MIRQRIRVMKHRQVFTIFLREAQRDAWGRVSEEWHEWRSQWCEEEEMPRCDACGIYGTLDEYVYYHNIHEPFAAGDGYFCVNCATPQHEAESEADWESMSPVDYIETAIKLRQWIGDHSGATVQEASSEFDLDAQSIVQMAEDQDIMINVAFASMGVVSDLPLEEWTLEPA